MKALLLLLLSIATTMAHAQTWTWHNGDSLAERAPIFGTKGVSAPGNQPGSRTAGATWVDNTGKLWLYGGGRQLSQHSLADLWRYDPVVGAWTWMQGTSDSDAAPVRGTMGVPNAANAPGGRLRASYWTDNNGNLWLYGGWTVGKGIWADMWKYDISNGMWTWVAGHTPHLKKGQWRKPGVADSSSYPGMRGDATCWKDHAGIFWLFGGSGVDSNGAITLLNDLWSFNPNTLLWTWVSGSPLGNKPGNYGTRGVASPTNIPPTRAYPMSWIDRNGKFWIFGGVGPYNITPNGQLNDLWMFDPGTGLWTWMHGDSTSLNSRHSVYGKLYVSSPGNMPGTRTYSVCWSDSSALWLFGGMGPARTTNSGLNDLWKYTIATNEWAWMGGDTLGMAGGQYGTKGVTASGNRAGARAQAYYWTDAPNKLWIYGGYGTGSVHVSGTNAHGILNDLWTFEGYQSLAILPVASKSTLRTYPNPSMGYCFIQASIPGNAIANISLTDMQGRLIQQITVKTDQGSIHTRLATTDLPAGLYLLRLTSENYDERIKLIVQ